ncbi:hypothetical protein [Lacimicrobium sp. SS2-24]|uniref:hypothetical protein n=1 Tax=Lacimicrobium sp. SS2-24 TaxID=2005569 RepID=UPI000B4BA776|nr:hypothetical protein [Lacimicrobium sp. SS2-24]
MSLIPIYIGAALTLAAGNGFATQEIIFAQDGRAEDYFGYSAAIDGNTVLVGAYKADVKGLVDAGAAYVYVSGENGWYQQAKLVAEPSFAQDTLGGNVALKNDVAMLGAMNRDDKGEDAGAVISFERQSGNWMQKQILTAPDARPGDAFGQSISLTEKHLVIGAPRNDALGIDSGAAYIYKRENDAWHYQTKVTASDGAQEDLFGISVAIDGNTILVGADLHDQKAENAGAVYVYVLDDNQWKQQAKLMASDGGQTDIFGVRVAISENTALVSARRDDIDGVGIDAGSAYIFERRGHVWTQKLKLTSPDGKADDRFGRGVALNKDTAIISAMNHDSNGADTGAVYVYHKGADGWNYTSKITAKVSLPNDRFGWNVGLHDGMAVISTPNHDGTGVDSGAVFIQALNTHTK